MKTCILLGVLCCAALTGCAEQQAHTEYGLAFRRQLVGQQLNPGPAEATPVTGLDGRAAQQAMEAYRTPDQDLESATAMQAGTMGQ